MTTSSSDFPEIERERELPEIEPMGIRAAIEAMKILDPYRDVIVSGQTLGKAIRQMLHESMRRHPIEMLRLLALMYDKDLDEIAEDYEMKAGPHFVVALAHGFEVNNVLGLWGASDILNLTDRPEDKDGR